MQTFALRAVVSVLFTLLAASAAVQAQLVSTPNFPHVRPTLADFLGRGKDFLDYPTLDMSANFVLQDDLTIPRNGGSGNSLYTTSELFTALNFMPRLSFLTHVTYDVVNPGDPESDAWFSGEGLYLEEAFLQYSNDLATLQVGKFDSDFGIAPSLAPGLYGNSLASNYQFNELLGVRAAYALGREIKGTHLLSASLFKVDDTVFSQSLFTNRGRTTRATGGPANTPGLDSFTFAYTATDVPIGERPILNYQLAYLNMAPGEDGTAREQGFAASIWMPIPLDNDVLSTIKGRYTSINPILEYVHLENDGGIRGQDSDYVTGGVDYVFGDYDVSVVGTWHLMSVPGSGSTSDYMVQTSLGRQIFGPNGSIYIGYQFQRLADQVSHTVGIALTFSPDILGRYQLRKGW